MITRSPPIIIENKPIWQKNAEEQKEEGTDLLAQMKQEEEKAFIELGNKLGAVNDVLISAKNIHKSIRDNITWAMAIYQQMRECREAISNNPAIEATHVKNLMMETKATQVDTLSPLMVTREKEDRGKRLPSSSPKQERKRKIQKTGNAESIVSTPGTINLRARKKVEDHIIEDITPGNDIEWETVRHRKEKKKKEQPNKGRIKPTRETGEAVVIKADPKTYADVIRKMKCSVDPNEIGVEITSMRRTRAGELLVKLKRGEGQAVKLKDALTSSLGEDIAIRSVVRNQTIDIRDMDESTDEQELKHALMSALGVQKDTVFEILNIREAYGNTRQALVRLPETLSARLVNERRIKVGWVRCRIRLKAKSDICFRCLDRGHRARECKGEDRTKLCRRCCHPGHLAKECQKQLRCILCQEAGLQNTDHLIGSTLCLENRRKHSAK